MLSDASSSNVSFTINFGDFKARNLAWWTKGKTTNEGIQLLFLQLRIGFTNLYHNPFTFCLTLHPAWT